MGMAGTADALFDHATPSSRHHQVASRHSAGPRAAFGAAGLALFLLLAPAGVVGAAAPLPMAPPAAAATGELVRTVSVPKGGSLQTTLTSAGVSPEDATAAIKALGKQIDPKKIAPGQTVEVRFAP